VHVSPDAHDAPPAGRQPLDEEVVPSPTVNGYRARLALASQALAFDERSLPLASGMQVDAEIHLGDRTMLEYVLAPVQKAWHESARER
jgi:HlyD family secretion protein